MKTYKVLKGYYKDVKEEEIIIPKNMKLLYNDGCIGNGLHNGHNHYLGCMKLTELPKEIKDYCEFCDLAFFVYVDIKFIDETPEFYTPEEFMNEFDLNNYYIELRTKSYFKNTVTFEYLESQEKFEKFIDDNYVEGSTYEICKITNIKGPYSVTLFSVSNGNKFNGDEENSTFNCIKFKKKEPEAKISKLGACVLVEHPKYVFTILDEEDLKTDFDSAFKLAKMHDCGATIPTKEQWKIIYEHLNEINNLLKNKIKKEYYWTFEEKDSSNSWYVYMNGGSSYNTVRTYALRVRPIKNYKQL